MKAIVVKTKSATEYRFIADLLTKLGVGTVPMSKEELEDFGLLKLMQQADKTKKASKAEVMKKLKAL